MKINIEGLVTLDRAYLIDKLKEISSSVIDEEFISFNYKNMSFFVFYEEDTFPAFYLESCDRVKYPHVIFMEEVKLEGKEKNISYVCLYENDSLYEHSFSPRQKIDYAITQLQRLFSLSSSEIEKEINKEYIYHWRKSCKKEMVSMVSYCERDVSDIKIFRYKKEGKKEKQKSVVSNKFPFQNKQYSITEVKCVYLDVLDCTGIYPPSIKEWSEETLYELFFSLRKNRISLSAYEYINDLYVKEKLYLILRYVQNNYFEVCIELTFKSNDRKKIKDKLEDRELANIEYISIDNRTIENSLYRNGQTPTKYKKVAIIGMGSLGSFLASELVKEGVKEFVFVDGDKLASENVSRHYLGTNFIGENKATSMNILLSIFYPHLNISAIDEKITKENIGKILDDLQADLIIVCTGNEDIELMINDYMLQRKVFIPILFCWLEANGVGAHAYLMDEKGNGCFRCVLDNKIDFLKNPQKFTYRNGCGGTYTEYGNKIVIDAISMILNILGPMQQHKGIYSLKEYLVESELEFTDYYLSLPLGVSFKKIDVKDGCMCNGCL